MLKIRLIENPRDNFDTSGLGGIDVVYHYNNGYQKNCFRISKFIIFGIKLYKTLSIK